MKNKIYIAGAGGMLGKDVFNTFKHEIHNEVLASDIDVNEDWIMYGDIRDYTSIKSQILDFNPDLIINLAALTDLEECESTYTNCMVTNTIGAINLMEISKELDIPYIFISTAGIFDGKKDQYTDSDIPIPLSIYGKSKVYAENYITNNYPKSWIFRAGWMMGGGIDKDKKFIGKLLNQINEQNKKEIFVVDDKLGTPTYTVDFANSILRHYNESLPFGVYNMVCQGNASRYDVALKIKEYLDLDIKIIKVTSDFFKKEYFAPRPFSEKLINFNLNKLNKNYMRDWEICLKEYLTKFYG